MATQSAVFSFALPEDENSNQLLIYSATTETGTYSLDTTVTYEYGEVTYEYDSLDDTKWYKIKFNNSTDAEAGPLSDAVYGGDFSKASPFLAVSTGTDGAHYATTQDVYDYSNLTTSDVSRDRVSQALRRARAVIDLRTYDLDLDRFTNEFESHVARKKFNANLRIVREAEINIALSNVYRGLADNLVISKMRDQLAGTDNAFSSVSIGNTTINESGGAGDPANIARLNGLANRYAQYGEQMLNSIKPTSVRLKYDSDYVTSPRFKFPFNGY